MTHFNLLVRFLVVHNTIVRFELSNADEIYRSLMEFQYMEISEYD